MNPTLIGIAGRAGSGKSTCSDWLVREKGARRFSFAEPLKRLAKSVFGFSDEQVWGTQAQKEAIDPRYGFSAREALIRLGNEARNELGPDVWLDACLRNVKEARDEGGDALLVIDDVRYPNEARAIATADWIAGRVVLLECSDAATTVDREAPSERSVDEIEPRHVWKRLVEPRSPGASALLARFRTAIDCLIVATREDETPTVARVRPTARWHKDKKRLVEDPTIDAFVSDVERSCRKHGFTFRHEDEATGTYEIRPFDDDQMSALKYASVSGSD